MVFGAHVALGFELNNIRKRSVLSHLYALAILCTTIHVINTPSESQKMNTQFIDVFSSSVAPHEADRFDFRVSADRVDGRYSSVNDIQDTGR